MEGSKIIDDKGDIRLVALQLNLGAAGKPASRSQATGVEADEPSQLKGKGRGRPGNSRARSEDPDEGAESTTRRKACSRFLLAEYIHETSPEKLPKPWFFSLQDSVTDADCQLAANAF